MKRKIFTMISICSIIMLLVITGCFGSNSSDKENNVTNNVTNEITNKVVNYEEMSVEDLQTAVQTAVKRVENASIGVTMKEITNNANYGVSEDAIGVGTGVIYKAEEIYENGKLVNYKYYAVTNRHVVVEEGKNIKIYAYLGYEDVEIPATVVGYDTKVDIACITFNHTTYIQPVEFGDSDELDKGTFVIAVGNSRGYDYYGTTTFGVVSGPQRYLATDTDGDNVIDFYGEYIQHDVSINHGNSGGGLFTLDGKVVGINTLKITTDDVDNMGFAIPSNQVVNLLEDYIEPGKEIIRPSFGVTGATVRDLTPYVISMQNLKPLPDIYLPGEIKYGIYVTAISANGTIASSPILVDDIILTIDGVKIKESSQLSAMLNDLSDYHVGSVVTLTFYKRSTDTIETCQVTLKHLK